MFALHSLHGFPEWQICLVLFILVGGLKANTTGITDSKAQTEITCDDSKWYGFLGQGEGGKAAAVRKVKYPQCARTY